MVERRAGERRECERHGADHACRTVLVDAMSRRSISEPVEEGLKEQEIYKADQAVALMGAFRPRTG